MVAVAACLLANGNALSTADDTKVLKMSSPDSVHHCGGEMKRALRSVEDANQEERGTDWVKMAKIISRTEDSTKKGNLMADLTTKFSKQYTATSDAKKWEEALDAYNYAIRKGAKEKDAMNFGKLFEDYVKRINGNP